MNSRLCLVQECVRVGRVELADHAYDKLVERLIDAEDAIEGVLDGTLIEDYLETREEDRILVLQREPSGSPLHTVWDLPLREGDPVILVSAYRPKRSMWSIDFKRRLR